MSNDPRTPSYWLGAYNASPRLKFTIILILSVLIIVARRWPQFVHPDVWVEDGVRVIPDFARYGWAGLFIPVSGYLVVPAKLVSFLALSISFIHYALISTILATVVQAACVAVIACAPTILKGRTLCALALLLIPTGPEVFALPIYTIWWTALLIVPALLWSSSSDIFIRSLLLAISGLSSPFVVFLLPLFIVRALYERTKTEYIVTLITLSLSAVQVAFILSTIGNPSTLGESLSQTDWLISDYFGLPLYNLSHLGGLSIDGSFIMGSMVLLILLVGFFGLKAEDRPKYILLGLLLVFALASSVSRVPVNAPHPLLAGPRYFFYPITFIIWMLIYLAIGAPKILSSFAALMIGSYIPALFLDFNFSLQVPNVKWSKQVRACTKAETYTFAIQYGYPSVQWEMTMDGADCRRLVAQSLIGR